MLDMEKMEVIQKKQNLTGYHVCQPRPRQLLFSELDISEPGEN